MINRMYQMYELKEDITKAIENCKNLLSVEEDFIKEINKIKNKERFDFIISDFIKDVEYQKNQVTVFTKRLDFINELLFDYEKKDENSEVISKSVSLLLESIGATAPIHEDNATA